MSPSCILESAGRRRTLHALLTLLAASWAATTVLPADAAEAGGTLAQIKSKGVLRCGVSEGLIGFSIKDATGRWTGMDVDFCRAVAAAALGDPEKVVFVPLTAAERFPRLLSGGYRPPGLPCNVDAEARSAAGRSVRRRAVL